MSTATVFSSRLFPSLFAVLQAIRHLVLLGADYWNAARIDKDFVAAAFIARDLARPLLEPYGFCGAYTHYVFGQSADLGIDLPVYVLATMLLNLVNRQAICVDALATPRGHLITTAFVIPIWFLVGRTLQRLARREWHAPCVRLSPVLSLSWVVLPALGSLAALLSALALIVSGPGMAVRLLGFAFWMTYLYLLAAERLRRWPFHNLADRLSVVYFPQD